MASPVPPREGWAGTRQRKTAVAAITTGPGERFLVETVELDDDLRPDEVLVRIRASGICHTDLLVAEGWRDVPFPVVLGHEGAGVVEAVGLAVRRVQPGDHVVTTFPSCGNCVNCRRGMPSCCRRLDDLAFRCSREDGTSPLSRNGTTVNSRFLGQSSFATFAIVNERSAVPVPAELPFEVAAPLGCAVITGAGATFHALNPEPGSSLAVFGLGAVGLSGVMAAVNCGCATIVVVDRHPERLKLAAELGATDAIDLNETDPVTAIRELTADGVDYALEAAGTPAALEHALAVLVPGGTCVYVGNHPTGTSISFDVERMSNSTLRGCDLGGGDPSALVDTLVRLHFAGRFPFHRVLTNYRFFEINEAAHHAATGAVVKPVLVMD